MVAATAATRPTSTRASAASMVQMYEIPVGPFKCCLLIPLNPAIHPQCWGNNLIGHGYSFFVSLSVFSLHQLYSLGIGNHKESYRVFFVSTRGSTIVALLFRHLITSCGLVVLLPHDLVFFPPTFGVTPAVIQDNVCWCSPPYSLYCCEHKNLCNTEVSGTLFKDHRQQGNTPK